MIFQVDVIDMSKRKKQPGNHKYILAVCDVHSRYLWTEMMLDKTAEQTTVAYRKIITRNNGTHPKQISCDLGREFSGKFAQYVEDNGTVLRLKDPASVNSIAIVDRSIQSLKQIIANLQVSSNAPWSSLLKKANTILVDREHGSLYGESPEGVGENKTVQYLLEAQAGKDIKHITRLCYFGKP